MNNLNDKKSIFSSFILAVLIIIVAFLIWTLFTPKSDYLKIIFFDVGQGDAALITTKENQNILIDGGPNSSVVNKLDKNLPFYRHTLDAVILTHPHADHLVGLVDVIKKYEIKNIYITGTLHSTPEYLEFLDQIKNRSIQTKIVKIGDSLDLGNEIRINFLYPKTNLTNIKVDNLNNSSIVAKLDYGQNNVIFMGDLETEGQNYLIDTGQNLESEIIKISHHGSSDSLNEKFLKLVQPKYAVISVGKDNKFNHPSQKVINFLKNVVVYRTDQDGDVIFKLTKNQILSKKGIE